MKLAIARAGVIVVFASLLQSCGGGGDGNGGEPPAPAARLTISNENISAAATPGELAPETEVTLTVSNVPDAGLFIGLGHSSSGVERIDFVSTSATQGSLQVFFKPPSRLTNGTYEDTIEVEVCTDDQCRFQIDGSPKTVRSSYVVSGDGLTIATISRTAIEVSADQREDGNREEKTTVTLSNLPPTGVILQVTESSNAIQHVGGVDLGTTRDFYVTFVPANRLGIGTHNGSIALKLCYDDSCVRQVSGSPFAITTTFNVTLGLEPGLSSLQILRREPLGHDVIDAEFSKAMNAIVMVGSYPGNAIYVYDVPTGAESQQLLSKVPTSLSVAPDGLTAAVGHDALVSVVDLPMVGGAAAPPPTLLDIAVNIVDVALDGSDRVHVIPTLESSDVVHSIDIATGTTTPSMVFTYGDRFRLHPTRAELYSAPDMIPSWLNKFDVSTVPVSFLYSDPYFGAHDSCGDLWFNESGDTIYTACGRSFRTSTDQAQDMVYDGSMALTVPSTYGHNTIRSLSHSAANNEISLIESDHGDCNPLPVQGPCFTRLAYYDDMLNRVAMYGIGPVTIGGVGYVHLGRYVFHNASSHEKYLIGEVESPPDENLRFWLSVIE